MPSVFTRIIAREIPGTFVHEDEHCAAFMTINPIAPGHLLVVPRAEVDQWIDLDPVSAEATFAAARRLAEAQRHTFACERVALVVAGFEVPHCHLHLIPASSMADLDFARAATNASRADLEDAAARIRAALPSN
ncbi:MAG: HIT family protein [Acidobacteria bacterium]|nr:HIT family protein [Acidobacteriota bacterium]